MDAGVVRLGAGLWQIWRLSGVGAVCFGFTLSSNLRRLVSAPAYYGQVV